MDEAGRRWTRRTFASSVPHKSNFKIVTINFVETAGFSHMQIALKTI